MANLTSSQIISEDEIITELSLRDHLGIGNCNKRIVAMGRSEWKFSLSLRDHLGIGNCNKRIVAMERSEWKFQLSGMEIQYVNFN